MGKITIGSILSKSNIYRQRQKAKRNIRIICEAFRLWMETDSLKGPMRRPVRGQRWHWKNKREMKKNSRRRNYDRS